MRRKIFDVSLWVNDPPENSCCSHGMPCASLVLPATPYKLLDALEKIRLGPGDAPHWHIGNYCFASTVIAMSEEQGSIYELNALAQKLSVLDERQTIAYQGLVELDHAKNHRSAPLSLLIDMACGTDSCRVMCEVRNDFELGKYCVKNGLIPNLKELPAELLGVLNYEEIGQQQRKAEGGIFLRKDSITTIGYAVQNSGLADAHKDLDLTLRQPDYTILLEVSGSWSESKRSRKVMPLKLPASQEALDDFLAGLGDADWKETAWEGLDCRVPVLTDRIWNYASEASYCGEAIAFINQMAEKLVYMSPAELQVCKALMEVCKSDIADAGLLIDMLDEFHLTSQADTPDELAEETLSAALSEEQAALLIPHVKLQEYGEDILWQRGGAMTAYGLLERKDGNPVLDQQAAINQWPKTRLSMGGMA